MVKGDCERFLLRALPFVKINWVAPVRTKSQIVWPLLSVLPSDGLRIQTLHRLHLRA